MSRPQKNRKVCNPPPMKGYKPYGLPLCKSASIRLSFEQYESIKLVCYEMLSQDEAAQKMDVSRPTLTRIYNKALKTIAKAFVEGKAIEIEGGNYLLEEDWYRCKKCYKLIQGLENHIKCKTCPCYSKNELISLNQSEYE
jgi:predicted DNA-binding protein (UPF0251 family)